MRKKQLVFAIFISLIAATYCVYADEKPLFIKDDAGSVKDKLESLRQESFDKHTAYHIVDEIKTAVSKGIITWNQLGVSQDELPELVKTSRIKGLKEDLGHLRAVRYSNLVAVYIAEEIRSAISDGIIGWDDLDTNEAELCALIKKNTIKDINNQLKELRQADYDGPNCFRYLAKEINTVVSNGTITWGDVTITEKEIGELARAEKVKNLKGHLKYMCEHGYDRPTADYIYDAVSNGITTFDELGTSKDELAKLAKNKRYR